MRKTNLRSAEERLSYQFNRLEHYQGNVGPTDEFSGKSETPATIRNIGWTLGNDCPFSCTHCYSMNAREKGKDMSRGMVDRIVSELEKNGIETVNLGGNEPLFTNGTRAKDTLLPYIIQRLHDAGIKVGLTTSGISLLYLYKEYSTAFSLLNDVDVSFDSPYEQEHNKNRGAKIFHQAIEAMEICQAAGKPHTAIMCAMNWNFGRRHILKLVHLAKKYDANIRINPLKPVEPEHMKSALTAEQYFSGFSLLMKNCTQIDLGEPPLAAATDYEHSGRCPCGRTSFRIHSITPTGEVFVSPCVYLHDYKSELDLLRHDLSDIINSPQFVAFRQRNAAPEELEGCSGCEHLQECGGGCAARSYLFAMHNQSGVRTLKQRDPYCIKDLSEDVEFPQRPNMDNSQVLVHKDYLCTWIGRPI